MKIGIIGAGKLAQGILGGWLDSKAVKAKDVWATTKTATSATRVKKKFKIHCDTKLDVKRLKSTKILLLAAKPYHLSEVIADLKQKGLPKNALIFSVLAGVSTQKIEETLGQSNPVVVTMTNTPCTLRKGMTTLYKGRFAKPSHMKLAQTLFSKVGHVMTLPEEHFHEVTALSASGPAFVYYFIKTLSEAAANEGLPLVKAQELAAQTFLGAATMVLHQKMPLDELIAQVTTPGGCTIEGIKVLQNSELSNIFRETIQATRNKSAGIPHT